MKPLIITTAATILAASALACGGGHDAPSGPGDSGVPRVPASISLVAGDQQTGVVNQSLPRPIQLAVRDSSGRAVPSHAVELRQVLPSGGGGSAVTDSLGIATFNDLRLPTRAGGYEFAGTVSEVRDTVRLHETAVATAARSWQAIDSPAPRSPMDACSAGA